MKAENHLSHHFKLLFSFSYSVALISFPGPLRHKTRKLHHWRPPFDQDVLPIVGVFFPASLRHKSAPGDPDSDWSYSGSAN